MDSTENTLSSFSVLLRYAFFGIPLGFIGLPLYVHLPKYYADTLPISLALIGTVMFTSRLLDCLADPWIGYLADRWAHHRLAIMRTACLTLGLGVYGLFQLPYFASVHTVWIWLSVLLALTYLSYSVLLIFFDLSGLPLAYNAKETLRVSAWREGMIIIGVLVASALPSLLMARWNEPTSYLVFAGIFIVLLALVATVSLRRTGKNTQNNGSLEKPIHALKQNRRLRWIFVLFFLNAIPSSITATLFLFFVTDILHQPEWTGIYLVIYFLSAVISMGGWSYLSKRIGKRSSLMAGMMLAIGSFVWAYGLGAGDSTAFMAICILSGFALGGDLAILPSLLADVLATSKTSGGIAFGIWNFISKLTLALAAGIALPLLSHMGYSSHAPSAAGLHALSFTYAILPCFFKCTSLGFLFISPIDNHRSSL